MVQNTNTKKYLSLFTPSATGVVLYTFISGLVVALNQFHIVEDYLQVPHDFNLFRLMTSWLDSLLTHLIGESRTEVFVVGLFWAFVGLCVYVFLKGVARFILELGDGLEERRYFWPHGTDRNQRLAEATQRTVFRTMAFIGFMFMIFGPLARLLDGPIWQTFLGPNTAFQLVVWFVAIWLTLHMIVILARLMVLRPRLYA